MSLQTVKTQCPSKALRSWRRRRATSSIEFVLVAIPLFTLVLASLEFGHGMMVVQGVEEAARCGCRTASLQGVAVTDVEAAVDEVMATFGITNYTTAVVPETLDTIPQWDPVTVSVTINFSDVCLLPVPSYLGGKTFTATCSLPREGSPN